MSSYNSGETVVEPGDVAEVHNRQESHFAKIPHQLLDDPDADRNAILLYAALARFANFRTRKTTHGSTTTPKLMAAMRNTRPEAFVKARDWLVAAGYVEFEPREGKANVYSIFSTPAEPTPPQNVGRSEKATPPQIVGGTPPQNVGGSGGTAPFIGLTRDTRDAELPDVSPASTRNLDEARRLCEYLAARVGTHSGTRPKWDTATNVRSMDLLLRRGASTWEKPEPITAVRVERAIDFVFDKLADGSRNGFCWADQIRSAGALREHWDRIRVEARKAGVRPLKPAPMTEMERVIAETAEGHRKWGER